MVLFWLWRAVLICYFSDPKISIPFNNLEELLTKSDKKVPVCKIENHLILSTLSPWHVKKVIIAVYVRVERGSKYHSNVKLYFDFLADPSKGIYTRGILSLFLRSIHTKDMDGKN
jgi:hypothetical protein